MFFGGCAWKLKPVSQPRFGQDVAGMRWVILNFLSKLVYHSAKVFRFLISRVVQSCVQNEKRVENIQR
jgi:hypothetical protein